MDVNDGASLPQQHRIAAREQLPCSEYKHLIICFNANERSGLLGGLSSGISLPHYPTLMGDNRGSSSYQAPVIDEELNLSRIVSRTSAGLPAGAKGFKAFLSLQRILFHLLLFSSDLLASLFYLHGDVML